MSLTSELLPEFKDFSKYIQQDLKFAVIGFGKMGILHSAILNMLINNCVKAIVDENTLLNFSASKLIKNISFYNNLEKMLEKENPEIVYVTTPAQSHYKIVSELMRVGIRYIFMEKPPTLDSKELTSLINLMTNRNFVMVGLQKRYSFPFIHAKKMIQNRVIGDIEKVYASIKSSDIMRPTKRFDVLGRGVLLDLGIHLIDLLSWIFKVKDVENANYKKIFTSVDDYFEATLKTEKNAQVILQITWSSPQHRVEETYIEAYGSNGFLKVTKDYIEVEVREKHPFIDDKTKLILTKPNYYRNLPPINVADPEFTLENIHFLYSIYSSIEPLTSIKNIAKSMELVDKLYQKAYS